VFSFMKKPDIFFVKKGAHNRLIVVPKRNGSNELCEFRLKVEGMVT
jgi:hypothetical protein